MRIEWREHAIGDATIIGEDYEPVGIFVQTANREHITERHNVLDFLFIALCRVGHDATRLVVGKIDVFRRLLIAAESYFNVIVLVDLITQNSQATVEEDLLFLDELVSTTTGRLLLECQELVDTHREDRCCGHGEWLWGASLRFSGLSGGLVAFHARSVARLMIGCFYCYNRTH